MRIRLAPLTDVMLRANGYFSEAEQVAAHKLIMEAMEKNRFRFPMIRDSIASMVKPLISEGRGKRRKK